MDEYQDLETNSEKLNNLEVENNPAKDFLYFVLDLLKTGIVVFILAFSLRYFAIQPFIVDGESMMPNYVNDEYLLAEKITYLLGQPKRGDVVVFRYPGNPNVNYIKRIIGLPGETIHIENSQVTIKNSQHPGGVVLKEDYLPDSSKTLLMDRSELNVTLDDEDYFVLGDNRTHSSDSREWGPLPESNIIGRSWLTILPVDRLQIHRRVSYPVLGWIRSLGQKALAAEYNLEVRF